MHTSKLIYTAVVMPVGLTTVRKKIQFGLNELDRGEGIPGNRAEAELKALSRTFRVRKHK